MKNLAVLEGLLFVVGEDGLTLEQISDVLEISEDDSKILVKELKGKYEAEDRGLRIDFLGNRFKLTTKFEHKEYYQKLIENPITNTLSQAALETLAIIAYKQPITRVEIEEIRGVGADMMLRKLLARDLIQEAGRSKAPGRPILYEVTNEFLNSFKLMSLEELPDLPDFKSTEESDDLFENEEKTNE